jgi:hypothetical protein
MTRSRRIVVGALMVCGLVAGSAAASTMRTYEFDGTLTDVKDPMGVFDPSIEVGSPFTMTVTIPTNAPSDPPGHYSLPAGTPGASFAISFNGQPFTFSVPQEIGVGVDSTGFHGYQSFGVFAGQDVHPMRLDFNLPKSGTSALDYALPATLDLADFGTGSVYLPVWTTLAHWVPGLTSEISGRIEKATVLGNGASPPPIPEPTTLAIFGAAFAGLIGVRQSRRRRAL